MAFPSTSLSLLMSVTCLDHREVVWATSFCCRCPLGIRSGDITLREAKRSSVFLYVAEWTILHPGLAERNRLNFSCPSKMK